MAAGALGAGRVEVRTAGFGAGADDVAAGRAAFVAGWRLPSEEQPAASSSTAAAARVAKGRMIRMSVLAERYVRLIDPTGWQ